MPTLVQVFVASLMVVWAAHAVSRPAPRRVRALWRLTRLWLGRLAHIEVRMKPGVDLFGGRCFYPVWGNAWDHFGDDLIRFGFDTAWTNFKLAARTPNRRKLG
jgi:hypothetical protein